MTHSCRICAKLLCPYRGEIEGCKDCVSYVLLAMREIDKKLEEDYNARILPSSEDGSRNI